MPNLNFLAEKSENLLTNVGQNKKQTEFLRATLIFTRSKLIFKCEVINPRINALKLKHFWTNKFYAEGLPGPNASADNLVPRQFGTITIWH